MRKNKKAGKRLFIALIAVILLSLAAASFTLMSITAMTPAPTGQISNSGIYSVKNESNSMFFIRSDNGYILIDASSSLDKVKASLAGEGINPLDVSHLLLTHSDYDHVDALELFENAAIYIDENEMPLLNKEVKRNFFQNGNSLPEGISPDDLILLKDGQILNLDGVAIECFETPGHTTGSMSYIVGGRFIFTGDAVKIEKGVIGIHPFTMDKKLAEQSAQRIFEIKDNYELIITAHYGAYAPDGLAR